jgi:hypothetical protein
MWLESNTITSTWWRWYVYTKKVIAKKNYLAIINDSNSCPLSTVQLFVVATTLSNWDFSQFLQGHGPAQAWTGAYFYENWAVRVF